VLASDRHFVIALHLLARIVTGPLLMRDQVRNRLQFTIRPYVSVDTRCSRRNKTKEHSNLPCISKGSLRRAARRSWRRAGRRSRRARTAPPGAGVPASAPPIRRRGNGRCLPVARATTTRAAAATRRPCRHLRSRPPDGTSAASAAAATAAVLARGTTTCR
jgi:hypothetical protein